MMSKRQDDKYIYNEGNQPNRLANIASFLRYRWLLVLVLSSALVSVVLIILRFTKFSDWKPAEFVAITALILSFSAVLERSYASFTKRKFQIEAILEVSHLNTNHVKISACLHNVGTVTIEPDNISVFIDSGIYDAESKRYEFPFLLKHEIKGGKRKYDCILSEYCQSGNEFYPSDIVNSNISYKQFKDTFRTCYKFKHLSEESILYIGAGEDFSEDLIIKLDNPGIYRVILIITAKDKACDCICKSKQFMITSDVLH